jgi:hypothetical protein
MRVRMPQLRSHSPRRDAVIESLVSFWLAVRGLMWVLVALSAITLLAFVLDGSEAVNSILRGSGDNGD